MPIVCDMFYGFGCISKRLRQGRKGQGRQGNGAQGEWPYPKR